MAVGDLFEVKVYCRLTEQLGLNVSHWRITSISGSTPTDNVIADAISTALGPTLRGCLSSQAAYAGLTLQYLAPGAPRPEITSISEAGAGTVTGDALPRQVAGLLTLRTALTGRANRGRKYIPFPAEEDNNSDARPTATYLVQLAAHGAVYAADVLAGTPPVSAILHCHVYQKALGIAQAVTTVVTRTDWATQRRRSAINPTDAFGPF